MSHETLSDDYTYCSRCGNEYNWRDQDAPEDAAYYWVPTCPVCRAKMTDNPPDEGWLEVLGNPVGDYDVPVERLHAHARLVHGRLAGMSVQDLVDRARYLDSKTRHDVWGPRKRRNIAFRLRRQARDQLRGDDDE